MFALAKGLFDDGLRPMTPATRLHFFDTEWTPRLRAILKAKGDAYGTTEEVHANFKAVEALGITSFQRAKLARLVEKAQRLALALDTPKERDILYEEAHDIALLAFILWVDRE